MKLLPLRVMLGLAIMAPSAAQAQEGLPDPDSISLPSVAADDPKVIKEGYKFFYFHRPENTFSEALADVAECRSFMHHGVYPPQSSFIPWVEPAKRPVRTDYLDFNLVKTVLAAIILPKLNRGLDNNIVRRCMEPRGYKRYPLPEASWKAINEGEEVDNILKQAKLASGPAPTAPEVTEK